MQNQSELEQSLTRLKPTAERTVLKNLTMAPELEDRILQTIQSDKDTVQKPISNRHYLWTIVVFAIVMATTFTVLGLLHSSKTTRLTLAAVEASIITATPAAAVSRLLVKDHLRMGDYRVRALSVPYNVT